MQSFSCSYFDSALADRVYNRLNTNSMSIKSPDTLTIQYNQGVNGELTTVTVLCDDGQTNILVAELLNQIGLLS